MRNFAKQAASTFHLRPGEVFCNKEDTDFDKLALSISSRLPPQNAPPKLVGEGFDTLCYKFGDRAIKILKAGKYDERSYKIRKAVLEDQLGRRLYEYSNRNFYPEGKCFVPVEIEDFLEGESVPKGVHTKERLDKIARQMALIHQSTPAELDKSRWEALSKITGTNINCPYFRVHLEHPDFAPSWQFLEKTLNIQKEETIEKLLKILEDVDQNDICFCHNDIWGDNLIQKGDELYVIDFGDADWGFRAWDLCYFLLHNQSLDEPEESNYFLRKYSSYINTSDPIAFFDQIRAQVNVFAPYLLIEQILFCYIYHHEDRG